MIRSIFLDLDNTLMDFNRAEAEAIHQTFQEAGLPCGEAVQRRYHEINDACWAMLEAGELPRERLKPYRFEQLFRELGLQVDADPIWRAYEGHLGEGAWLLPGAVELLETLSPRYDLYLASNGTLEVQRRRLRKAGIGGYFKGIFISQEIGADKPSREFFLRCIDRIPSFCPEEAIVIGDSLRSDILGGRRAGLRTCWVNWKHAPGDPEIPADHTVTSLQEIPALLERL